MDVPILDEGLFLLQCDLIDLVGIGLREIIYEIFGPVDLDRPENVIVVQIEAVLH